MRVHNTHSREVTLPAAAAFAEITAMGTAEDRIWPAPRMPFRRTDGAPRVGVTTERHGIIRATLDRYQPDQEMVWRSTLGYLGGTHGFFVEPLSERRCRVDHVLDAKLSWWFAPLWRLWMVRVHDRLIERLLDRLELAARP